MFLFYFVTLLLDKCKLRRITNLNHAVASRTHTRQFVPDTKSFHDITETVETLELIVIGTDSEFLDLFTGYPINTILLVVYHFPACRRCVIWETNDNRLFGLILFYWLITLTDLLDFDTKCP